MPRPLCPEFGRGLFFQDIPTMRKCLFLLVIALLLVSCKQAKTTTTHLEKIALRYATNLTIERAEHYAVVRLANPWTKGQTLQTYILVDSTLNSAPKDAPSGTLIHIPLRKSAVFTSPHASLLHMLHKEQAVRCVADQQYMLLPYVHQGIQNKTITDCGNSMQPNIERMIALQADAILLSPYEGSSYGALEKSGIPIILCADYMETSALGRAEWMRFYGLLFGAEQVADSLFGAVEKNYLALKSRAKTAKQTLSVLPDRKVGSIWYVPGGQSSTGMLYHDAAGSYAYASDTHSGSLSLPFETVLDRFAKADFWIMSYQGSMTRQTLLGEYHGYKHLKPYQTGETYGCPVDQLPYFEQVSWRPDWLLGDLIQLFHPDLRTGKPLRYYKKIQ